MSCTDLGIEVFFECLLEFVIHLLGIVRGVLENKHRKRFCGGELKVYKSTHDAISLKLCKKDAEMQTNHRC
uniref:Uncharacterized protein n=1 Tax=Nelumbo nucifera TaxID=4432 RepID=A0A822YPY8_NELNU|nr:TPA_asm: hypothetical protein HUJ06_012260 [Nelumbo nucifera]